MSIQIVKEITADVIKRGNSKAVYAKQNDVNSRFLNVRIQAEGNDIIVEPTSTVLLNVERSDKTTNIFECTINPDGTVKAPLTAWMLELSGTIICDISIIAEDTTVAKLTTMPFNIYVEMAVVSDSDIQDSEDYSIIIDLLNKAEADYTVALEAAERAEKAALIAENSAPTAIVAQNDQGASITIIDKNGQTRAEVFHGKSAYEYAVAGGYEGTEQQFYAHIGDIHILNSLEDGKLLDVNNITDEILDYDYFKIVFKNGNFDFVYTLQNVEKSVAGVSDSSLGMRKVYASTYYTSESSLDTYCIDLKFYSMNAETYTVTARTKYGDRDWENFEYTAIYGCNYKMSISGEVCVANDPSGGVSSWNDLTDKPFGENADGTIKQLDNKYLQPFERQEESVTDILAETSVTFSNGLGTIDTVVPFVEGETYYVVWDGTEYICIAKATESSVKTISLGNASMRGGGDNTGEPFCINYIISANLNTFNISTATNVTHTVRIYQGVMGKWLLKKEYLPNGGGGNVTVDSELSLESENPVQNKVVAQEFKAFNEAAGEFNERLTSLEKGGGGGSGGVSSWNDLTDKPFGENADGTVKQLDNKYLEPFESKDAEDLLPRVVSQTFLSDLGVFAISSKTTEEMFWKWQEGIKGNVFVEFDGVTYECSPQRLAAMDNGMAVGNCTNFGGTGNDEPFVVTLMPETTVDGVATGAYYWAIAVLTDTAPTEHTVRVSQPLGEPKYMLKESHLPFDAIAAYIDSYIDEALGGDY